MGIFSNPDPTKNTVDRPIESTSTEGSMSNSVIVSGSDKWRPIAETERLSSLDIIRGLALLGVLLVNALTVFRISLFEHILRSHSHQGLVNLTVDMIIAGLIEFKAIALFTLMFGIGIGVQAERAATRSIGVSRFLVGRFLALLVELFREARAGHRPSQGKEGGDE